MNHAIPFLFTNGEKKMNQSNFQKVLSEKIKDTTIWKHGFFVLFFLVCFEVGRLLTLILIIFQFFHKLVTGESNLRIKKFCKGLNQYLHSTLDYATLVSDEKPYPFSPWPVSKDD